MSNGIISFHHTAPVKTGRYFCDLYAFGKCTPLTNEEYVEWLTLRDKSERRRRRFVNKVAKLREGEVAE